MTQRGGRRTPLRLGRKARRTFYKVVHAVLPAAIRQPLRNAIKGPPPPPEELTGQREAMLAERRAQREAHERAKAEQAREKERGSWVKAESNALKRAQSAEARARADAERRARREAQERAKTEQVLEKARESRVKAESDELKGKPAAEARAEADAQRKAERAEREAQKAATLREKEVRATTPKPKSKPKPDELEKDRPESQQGGA